jgi:glyoxylate reductase
MVRPKVLVTHNLLPEAMEFLRDRVNFEVGTRRETLAKERLIQKVRNKDGLLSLLVDTIDREVLEAAPHLRIIANCAVGFDNIDLVFARRRRILVTNTPGVLTETTADLTWTLLLAVARRIPEAEKFTRAGRFKGWALDLFLGKEVSGKRLGIVGMGRIGRAVAQKAKAFRMNVTYYDLHRLNREEEKYLGVSFLPLDEVLAGSDFITVHASLTPETHHLISTPEFMKMKKEAILVNVARGPIVDERALVEALQEQRIWGAGLDVYEHEPKIESELKKLRNVVLLPHIGSATYETRLRMALMAAKNLVQGLNGERPDNAI